MITFFIYTGRSIAVTIALAVACSATSAADDSQSVSSAMPACPVIDQLERASVTRALEQQVKALNPDLMSDLPKDTCDPPLNMTMAMNRAGPLCAVMGVETPAVALAYTPAKQFETASVPAAISYMPPYTEDAYQSIVTRLRQAGFDRVVSNPYPDLTFRKKAPVWEINDFYRRGEIYAHLSRDTDFKKLTLGIGSVAAIRLMTRNLNTCD